MQIVYKGHLFSQTREYRETRYFGCVKRKRKECFCRVHIVGHRVVKEIGEHSHPPLYTNVRLKGVIHVRDDGVVEVPEGQESPFLQNNKPWQSQTSNATTTSASSSPSVSSVTGDISGYWYDPATLNYQCLDMQVESVEWEAEDPPFIGPYLSSSEAAAKDTNSNGNSNSARQSDNTIHGRTSYAPIASPVPDLVERMVEGGEDGPCISGGDTPGPSASSPVLATSSSPAVTLITTTNTATRTPAPEPTPSVEVQKQYEPKKLIADCLEEGPVIRETEPSNVGLVQGLAGPYLLKKETHCTSILDQLLRDETYADVTLTAEGQNIRAHRVILSLASNYFRHVLSRDANVQSVVVLRDVKFAQLQNIIHFIYTGETTVDASQLDGFMKTAELLEITSLSDGHKALGSRGLLNTTHTSETLASQPDQRTPASKRTRPGGSECSAKTRRISGLASSSSCDSREEKTLDPMSNVKVEPADEVCKRATGSKRRLESIDDETGTNGEPLEVEVEEISQNESLGTDKEGGNPCNTTSNAFSHDDSASSSPSVNTDAIAAPGRCPYCPHLSQQFMDVAMMRHLLVTHPCKPAFPCDVCWRVYVRRNHFKAHQRVCNNGEKLAE